MTEFEKLLRKQLTAANAEIERLRAALEHVINSHKVMWEEGPPSYYRTGYPAHDDVPVIRRAREALSGAKPKRR